jgi:hypothetical protein
VFVGNGKEGLWDGYPVKKLEGWGKVEIEREWCEVSIYDDTQTYAP